MITKFRSIFGFKEKKSAANSKQRTQRANSLRGSFITKLVHAIEDDYLIDSDKPLGTGAFGVVVSGVNKISSRPFAIKFINKFSHLPRIEREIKLMTDIDHANVIRLFSVYDSDSQVAFVMDLCTGGHLGAVVKRAKDKYLAEDYAKILIKQLISAVAHIHSKGICHRDIKMQNILLENMDSTHAQIKLIDFGFATRYVGVTPMKTRCGTPYSTAPEVFRECYDERCDVWSVGIVSYYLLCGARPFAGVELPGDLKNAGKAAMASNILMGRYHFNYPAFRKVSAEGISFIQKLLAPNYRNRCSSKEALGLPWLSVDHTKTKFDFDSIQNGDTPLSAAVSNLRGKRKSSVLGNTGMVAVAFDHSRENAPELRSLFQEFDTENAGVLSKEAFRKAMKSVSPDLSPVEIDQLFAAIDVDDDKQISFTEFLAATMDPREVDMQELGKAFRLLDSDNKGYLTVDDFYRVLSINNSEKNNGFQLSNRALAIKVNNSVIDLDSSLIQKGMSSSEDISKSGYDFAGDADNDRAGNEREKAILMKKIAQMITTADSNNDGVLSYSEFLVGIVGMDGTDVEQPDENGNIDATAALNLLSEQRDVFTHSSLAKGSQKRKLRSLLSSADAPRGHLRGNGGSEHISPLSTPRSDIELPISPLGAMKISSLERIPQRFPLSSPKENPSVSPKSEKPPSDVASPSSKRNFPVDFPLTSPKGNLPSDFSSPSQKEKPSSHFPSPSPKENASSTCQSPSSKGLPYSASLPLPKANKENDDDHYDMLDMCSTVDVGGLGSFIRLQNPSFSSPSSPSTPPLMKGPPIWIADKKILQALNNDKGKARARTSSSPLSALPPLKHTAGSLKSSSSTLPPI